MTPDSIPIFDLYAELEVSRLASVAVIEAAYRSLAKTHHPDVGPSRDADRIKRLNTAREWLVDPVRRRRYDWATNAGLSNARPPAGERPQAPEAGADSTATEASFGPNAAEVREFLADLRALDEHRAEQVRNGRAVAQANGYPSARQAAVLAGRTHRHAEWLFAREAASVIARGKLGDSTLTDQVLDVLADAAGAIAIRDLIAAADYDALLVPWNWRREPATAARPARRPAKPVMAAKVVAEPRVSAAPHNGRAEAPATASVGAAAAGAASAFGGGEAASVGATASAAAGAETVAAPIGAPVAAGIGAAVRAAASAYRAGPIGSAVAVRATAPPNGATAGAAAAGAAAAGAAAAAAAPVPPLARPMSVTAAAPARPVPALAPAPMPIAAIREPGVARLTSALQTSRAVIFALVAVVMVVGVAFGLAASKPQTAVADVTDAPSGTSPAVVTGATSPLPSTPVVASTPAGTTDPATVVPEPSATATPLRTTKPGTVPVGGPTSTPKVTERPTSVLPTPEPTPSPTAAPTPTAVPTPSPTAAPVPTAAPTPSPTAAPVPTAPTTCTVVNLVNVNTNDAGDMWDDAGFTGPVIFTPDPPPNYTIKWQSLTAGSHVPCSWGVFVRQTKPWWA